MWGKVLGGMIGAAIGLMLGETAAWAAALGVLGVALGHLLFDREPSAPRSSRPPSSDELLGEPRPRPAPHRAPPREPSREHRLLAEVLCPIFIEVARADSPVVQSEVRVIREFFEISLGFDEVGMEVVRQALKDGLAASEQDIEHLVKRARTEVKPSLRFDVVQALYDMGLADADLTKRERDVLKQVVQHFNLSDEQLQKITTQYFGGAEAHYEALGLTEAASDEDIRGAFRRLATEHHPDRVAALGASEAAQAAERFRQVKDAYDALRKIRGF